MLETERDFLNISGRVKPYLGQYHVLVSEKGL